MPRFDAQCLDDWLGYLEALHPAAIDMGLTRVAAVRDAMGLNPSFPVLIVAGTNGKGSVCAMLSHILRAAGYRVGTYTSPHLQHYNERVMLNLTPVSDQVLVDAFRQVESARGETTLTYFEFGTLAAMRVFIDAAVDVAVLEVGLGGRLDAVNVFEPDASAVVSVGLDHQAFLGDTREAVGHEKAGVYRTGKPAFCADPNPPQSLLDHADEIGTNLRLIGCDFGFQKQNEDRQWMAWSKGSIHRHALPFPALRGDYQLGNAALVLAMLDVMQERLPVGLGDIKRGLLEVEWPARFQVLPGRPVTVLDVAHNPHAARVLRASLDQMGFFPETHAVFGMMADKDIAGVVACLADRVSVWHVAAPQLPRAADPHEVAQMIRQQDGQARVYCHASVADAWREACKGAGENDRILAFGSFYTVAEVMAAREA